MEAVWEQESGGFVGLGQLVVKGRCGGSMSVVQVLNLDLLSTGFNWGCGFQVLLIPYFYSATKMIEKLSQAMSAALFWNMSQQNQ